MIHILPYWPLLVASTPVLASATLNNPVQQRQLTDFPLKATGRFCEGGGHRCSAPKECCPQGCCYLFAPPSPPKAPPPAVTDHVLNLFLFNHWYFWCVILAIVLVLLCVCTLWRKRRQLCGWGSSGGHHQHSEGDSAGSCYLPPQYSRCSSFHHAPPPYTEVTSKPDLYPLVFTCNGGAGDNGNGGGVGGGNGGSGFGKNGTGYLMVHYFRNYIVRPVGSLSATSTVDSLSSSFICTVNEANTIVPPPYSRAASPGGGNEVVTTALTTTTTATGTTTPRFESHQSQQQRSTSQSQVLLAQTDFNHISRSESMQQESTAGDNEMMMVMQQQQQQDFHYCRNNEDFPMTRGGHRPHHHPHHPAITGRSLSAPLVDDCTVDVEPMAAPTTTTEERRVTVDWGNGCYANVDCSTGCGRERFHNHNQHRMEQQRRSGGMNVDVVVETAAGANGRQSFCGQEIKTNNSQHNNKVDRSRTPSFERDQTALDRMMTGGGGGGGGVGLPGNCHNNMTAVDGAPSGFNRSFGNGGATVCYSRSEYELRKVKLGSAGMATNGFGGGGRSLEGNDSLLVQGQMQANGLFSYYNQEMEAYRNHQQLPSPRPRSYNLPRGETLLSPTTAATMIESGHQMDRLTDELNDLFNNVEMALSRVPSRNDRMKKRKTGPAPVDAQFNLGSSGAGMVGQSPSSTSPTAAVGEGEEEVEGQRRRQRQDEEAPDSPFLMDDLLEKSFSDLRLDLGTRARLRQRQSSVDQESSSRRDYMESPLNKSMMGSNPFDNLMYMNSSNTGSAVSSLVNMDSPGSPPQATSPTDEMRELLEQINQLQRTGREGEGEQRVAAVNARDEEERIMERLRRDSDEDQSERRMLREREAAAAEEERRLNDDRMADEESLESDWMLDDGGSRTNKNKNTNNSSAKNTDNNHSNNKSTKRPLSFQNNSHNILNSLLLMAAAGTDDGSPIEGEAEQEQERHDSLHNNKNRHEAPPSGSSGRTQQYRNSCSLKTKDFGTIRSSCNSGHVISHSGGGRFGSSGTGNSKPNKSFYIPVTTHSPTAMGGGGILGFQMDGRAGRKLLGTSGSGASSRTMHSPTTSGGFFPGMILGARKLSRLSRSAPTTPGTALPPPRFDDVSPLLLDEHEEEENV